MMACSYTKEFTFLAFCTRKKGQLFFQKKKGASCCHSKKRECDSFAFDSLPDG